MLMKLNTVVVNYLRVCMKENNLSRNKSREIIVYQAGSILWWFDSQFWFNLFEHVVKQMDNLDWTRLLYLKLNLFLFTTSLYDILQLTQQLFSWQIVPLMAFHVPFLYKRWNKRIKRLHTFDINVTLANKVNICSVFHSGQIDESTGTNTINFQGLYLISFIYIFKRWNCQKKLESF